MRKTTTMLAITLAASLGIAGPAQADNLVDVVRNEGNFSMLLEALESTGLMETLASGGPYTLLAPSDEAFEKLSPNALKVLFQYSYKESLAEILQYHVIHGELTHEDIKQRGDSVDTMLGQSILISELDGMLLNDEARVVSSNRLADNGIVHVIDAVIFPE
jgi:uncharacterized surface protein with fasciclin (FAS1) repeats